MTSDSRKRPADLTLTASEGSKRSKMSDATSVATASEERSEPTMETYSIRRLLDSPDFNSYASSARLRPKAVPIGTPGPLRANGFPSSQKSVPAAYKPTVLHPPPHPLSKVGQSGHWLPYPLGLMPYDSWYKLHHGVGSDVQPKPALTCPVCGGKREMTAHMHKLFLVAERLAWERGPISVYDQQLNAHLNTKINNALGVRPVVNHPVHLGGRHSNMNILYPYCNEHEMMLALKLLSVADGLTEGSWSVWFAMQPGAEDLRGACEVTGRLPSERPRHTSGLLTPSVSSQKEPVRGNASSNTPTTTVSPIHAAISAMQGRHCTTTATTSPSLSKRIISYKNLQDFYALLDRIERKSYVGALFLEAYAGRLKNDLCKDCWFAQKVRLDVFK